MFHFNRKPKIEDTPQGQRFAEKQARREAMREEREQARQNAYETLAEQVSEQHNIAVYFNQRRRDLPGYEMSIRQKQPGGSVELAHPITINAGMIGQIQESDGVFLEGHLRDSRGLEKDIYDSDYPREIMREKQYPNGTSERSVLKVDELEAYDLARRESKPRIGPKARVIEVDDIMNIPLKGAVSNDDPSFR